MGGKGGDSPDYEAAAVAEAESSLLNTERQTWANRPDQYTPYGATQWEQRPEYDPVTGETINKWTQYETLNPDLQKSLDYELALQQGRTGLASGMLGRVEDEFSQPMDWDKFGDMTGVDPLPGMEGADVWNQKAEDNAMAMSTRRLDPQFATEQSQLEIKMRNQGLTPGDEAWDSQMEGFDTRKTDAYQSAMNNARSVSGQEASRMQGMDKSSLAYNQDSLFRQSDYSNQLRQQAITEDMTRRGFSLNEINAIIEGQQVTNPEFQDFSQASKADTTQYLSAATSQGNADQASAQGAMSGVGGLVSAGVSAYTGGMVG